MNLNSLRSRVTSFYVGMLALALLVFCIALYVGVGTYLTKSLEHSLGRDAHTILTDFVKPLDGKGQAWFVSEMSEAYPQAISDPFVRVSRGAEVLYQSDDIKLSKSQASPNSKRLNAIRYENVSGGQQLIIYTLLYRPSDAAETLIETGGTTDPIRHVLRSLLLIMLLTTPITLLAATTGGYFLMARILQPVVLLTKRAERVGRQRLGERLPVIPTGDELERLSLALNRMIERLEEALAHNRRFSADASHELRTPLTIIRGELEALIEMPLSPAALDGVGSALEESARMSKLVHSLMTITRLDDGGERIDRRPVNLVRVAQITLDHMSLLAEEKHITLAFQASGPVCVTGDEMRLKQVVVNLLDNAIKYTSPGGSVTVDVRTEGARAVLRVSDTGIGIPPGAVPFVFERFYRTDQARSRESGGIGLGLSIVKSICGAHEGMASVESVEGKGTTFSVELPLLSVSDAQLDEVASESETLSELGGRRSNLLSGAESRRKSVAGH